MRHLYVIEATAKPRSVIGGSTIIPKRILYVDSEGWFITASDQFDNNGQLWKTLATFHAYRDRALPQLDGRDLALQTHVRDRAG